MREKGAYSDAGSSAATRSSAASARSNLPSFHRLTPSKYADGAACAPFPYFSRSAQKVRAAG